MHLEKEASIPDHCEEFSLSGASNPDYEEKCQHNQEDTCEQCEALNYTLREKTVAIFRLMTSVVKRFTLCSHRSLSSVHGSATYYDYLTKTYNGGQNS